MTRTLLTPRWLGGMLVAVLFAAAALALGTWQYGKHQERVAWRDQVERYLESPPRPAAEVLGDGVVSETEQWIPVLVRGSYLTEHQLLVRNRPHHGVFGYEVLVPLRSEEGFEVLINRGWVPNAPSADVLPEVPEPPAEPVELRGWARQSETDLGRNLPTGQLASINAGLAAQATGLDLIDGYLILDAEGLADGVDTADPGGEAAPRPEPLEPPRTGLGAHFAYALQWWLTAPLGFVLVLVFARREHRDSLGLEAAKPRKHRIWDDEDE